MCQKIKQSFALINRIHNYHYFNQTVMTTHINLDPLKSQRLKLFNYLHAFSLLLIFQQLCVHRILDKGWGKWGWGKISNKFFLDAGQ